MITKLKRICFRLSAVFAVLAIFSTLFIPVRAEMIDYNDYVTGVDVDGENDLVTVRIPAELSYVYIFRQDYVDGNYKWIVVKEGYGGNLSYKFEDGKTYRVTVYPLGYRSGNEGLLLKYIPAGTTIYSGFGFDYQGNWSMSNTPVLEANYYYLTEGSEKYVHYDNHNLGPSSEWDFFTDSYTVQSYDNADLLSIEYFATNFWFHNQALTGVKVSDTLMVFSISSLLRQQQLTGKSNELLKQVEIQLAEQGKTLDDIRNQNDTIIDQNDQIINGTVTPEAPDGSDRVDDLDDSEAVLRDDAQDGLDTGIEITQNALQIILQYATAFACAGWIFECFSTLPLFTALLFVSMALGIFGFVANIVQEVGAESREAKRRDQKHQNRKIIRQSRRK